MKVLYWQDEVPPRTPLGIWLEQMIPSNSSSNANSGGSSATTCCNFIDNPGISVAERRLTLSDVVDIYYSQWKRKPEQKHHKDA